MYFCWQRGVGRKWAPVMYNEKPQKSPGGPKHIQSPFIALPAGMSFDEAIEKYPAPPMDSKVGEET